MYRIQNNIFYKSQKNNEEEKIFELNEDSELDLMVIDDFYEDPMAVREFALSQNFDITGNFPGKRTIPFSSTELNATIQECVKSFGNISKLDVHDNGKCIFENCNCFSSSFFINTVESEMPWIHYDEEYTAVIYLTPNAPLNSGTLFLESKKDINILLNDREYDKTKFLEIDKIGNKFNRLIIFNSKKWHLPNNYFGINKEDGRLTQTFWFNIIKNNKEENQKEENQKIIKSLYNCKLNFKRQLNIIVIDNFYKNPSDVRKFAILQNFIVEGNYPGFRTKQFRGKNIEEFLKKIYINFTNKKNNIYNNEYTGSFQYTTSKNRSWIHRDNPYEVSGLIYLTPDAPYTSGTTIYEYYNNTYDENIINKYNRDMTKWKKKDVIGNSFNRFVCFNSSQYHMSNDYFGLDILDGRLFQVFFL